MTKKKTKRKARVTKYCVFEGRLFNMPVEIDGFREGFVHKCFTSRKAAFELADKLTMSRSAEYSGSVGVQMSPVKLKRVGAKS